MVANQNIEIGDIVICNDIVGIVVGETKYDFTLRDKDNQYRVVSRNSKGLALISSAYAHCALFYKRIMGGV